MPDAQMVYFGSIGPGEIHREIMLAAKQTSFEFLHSAGPIFARRIFKTESTSDPKC